MQKLTTDLNIIQALDDRPNANTGLTPEEVKAKFDEAVNIIKTFINNTLTAELEAKILGNAGADAVGCDRIYVDGISTETVRGQLEKLKLEIEGVSQGAVPDGSITDLKLSNASGQLKNTVSNQTGQISALETSLSTNYYDKTGSDGRYLRRENNLSDLNNLVTARTNLGVYSKTEVDTEVGTRLTKLSNLSDLNSISTARNNLSVYSKAEGDGRYLIKSSNLSDLTSSSSARTNLGLGTMATRNVVVQTWTPGYVADLIWLKPIS